MKRFTLAWSVSLLGFLLLAAGCGSGSTSSKPAPKTPAAPTTQPTPPSQAAPAATPAPAPAAPAGSTPSSLSEEIPFKDAGLVRQAISAPSPVTYRVVNLGPTGGADKTQVLDEYMAKHQLPGQTDLVLVVFGGDGYDIRFGMGAIFREKGIGVEEMLGLVRSAYFPEVRKGQPEAGLAALVQQINLRVK